jgi:anti-sigma factor RsiW
MSHPKPDELSEFLYDELPPDRRAAVAQHVESCADCRATIDAWRAVRTNLAAWKLPASALPPTGAARSTGALRWTAAAVLLLGAGYGVARMTERTEKPVDLAALRSDLAREVRQEVRNELTTELTNHANTLNASQRVFQTRMIDAMDKLETRQVVDFASLRKDMETMAVYAQERFNRLAIARATTPAGAPAAQDDAVAPGEPTAQ